MAAPLPAALTLELMHSTDLEARATRARREGKEVRLSSDTNWDSWEWVRLQKMT